MANPTRTPRDNDQTLKSGGSASNPFTTPILNPAELPQAPVPTALLPATSPRRSSAAHYHPRAAALHGNAEEERVVYPYKAESFSTGGYSEMTQISSIDFEKSNERESNKRTQRSEPGHRKEFGGRDPEKARHSPPRSSRDRASRMEAQRIAYLEDDDQEDARQLQAEKAANILLFLSGPCVILSFLNAIWTFISLLITVMAQPVRLCANRPTFGQQLGGLLGPALNLQLKCIHTPLPPHADEDTSYRSAMLVAIQLLSPFLSLGMMLAAWVVATFWLSSAVVGDPSGTDKRDDGRETVLALRSWWESWLMRSVNDD